MSDKTNIHSNGILNNRECSSCRSSTIYDTASRICEACKLELAIERYRNTLSPYPFSGNVPVYRTKYTDIDWEDRLLGRLIESENYDEDDDDLPDEDNPDEKEPDNEVLRFIDQDSNETNMTVEEWNTYDDYKGVDSCRAVATDSKGNVYEIIYKRIEKE